MVDNLEQKINDSIEYGSNTTVIRMNISKYQDVYLPDRNGKDVITAVFKKMSLQDSLIIDSLSFSYKNTGIGFDISGMDYMTYRILLLRRCLLKLDDKVLEHKNGWMIKEDWEKIKNFNAMILNMLITEFEYSTAINEDEEKIIAKQASILFGSDSGKVMNPHPAVSLYCTLSGIWDKFGLDIKNIEHMLYEDYLKIRSVMSKESEQMKKDMKRK